MHDVDRDENRRTLLKANGENESRSSCCSPVLQRTALTRQNICGIICLISCYYYIRRGSFASSTPSIIIIFLLSLTPGIVAIAI